MEGLPIDMSHPAVREYLSLVRLQVLTPLSLLINVATVIVCSVVVHPSAGEISKLYPTVISPRPSVIAAYVIAIYVAQIGYCILLVLVGKPETKKTLIKGSGFSLVLSNWVMALWAITWTVQWFLLSTILQGILLLLLLYSNVVLLIYHLPTAKRPFDTMLIHAPMRFFLVLQIGLMFPLSLFVTLGLVQTPTTPGPPIDPNAYQWAGFGVVLGTNILGLLVVVLRRDIVWCVAATWICISIWSLRPKPAPVYITAILFTAFHPLGLLASMIYSQVYRPSRISLPGDEHPGLHPNRRGCSSGNQNHREDRAAREVDEEAVWG
ncbi:uncharacterized protein BT62DRAFT_359936 [Guyanagaster necrorhizus]|uniref:Uncharacterized protein n=1 Tax=Guyanagaster necrorhizus TaxID=856835 RepID=A0A9P7VMV3_9AGAR|nr:uncharacterized protein BT62DRAFT_359936 [Guyanagaster necrorhizus MCA 3950]KAG7442841.1 hypothetical protein BT62DRAFT_359936 [Guyanagaster necrorhizus MCA 3950]